MSKNKIIIAIVLTSLVILFLLTKNQFNLVDSINANLINLKNLAINYPNLSGLYFCVIYILLTALSFPVALLLGISSGIIFNPYKAILLVSFASSIGATLAFLLSRYIFRDYLQNKYHSHYKILNDGFIKNGIYYLFALRMSPIFPYFLINILSGLTTIKVIPYYLITQIGMLPATTLIILLGNHLGKIILSDAKIEIDTILILSAIGILPLILKYIFKNVFKES